MSNHSLYLIRNKENGKCYVGQTSRDPKLRFREHFNKGSNCKLLKNALQKYSINSFEFHIVKEVSSSKDADFYEKVFIKNYRALAPFGYNCDYGGGNYTERRLAAISKGSSGRKAWNFGKAHSQETRDKISFRNKGKRNLSQCKPLIAISSEGTYYFASMGIAATKGFGSLAGIYKACNRKKLFKNMQWFYLNKFLELEV